MIASFSLNTSFVMTLIVIIIHQRGLNVESLPIW